MFAISSYKEKVVMYSESWPETVTFKQVVVELKKHGASIIEFINDLGKKDTYCSDDVLAWLGY